MRQCNPPDPAAVNLPRPNPAIVAARLEAARALSKPARAVLLALVTFTRPSCWDCWPAVSTLAAVTGWHKSTCYDAIAELIDAGLLTKRQRRNRPTIYTIQTHDSGLPGNVDSTIPVGGTHDSGLPGNVRTEDPKEDQDPSRTGVVRVSHAPAAPPVPLTLHADAGMVPAGSIEAIQKVWDTELVPAGATNGAIWKPLRITPGRRTAGKVLLESFSLAQIREAAIKARNSPHHRGKGKAGLGYSKPWRMSVKWFLDPDNVAALLEIDDRLIGPRGQHEHSLDDTDEWNRKKAARSAARLAGTLPDRPAAPPPKPAPPACACRVIRDHRCTHCGKPEARRSRFG